MDEYSLSQFAEEFTGLEGEEALFALAVATVKQYQLDLAAGNQVTLVEAERSLDTTLLAIKENLSDGDVPVKAPSN